MGLLLELRKKLADGTISEDEKKQLEELEADIKADEPSDDVDKEISDLSDRLASETVDKIREGLKDVELSQPVVEVQDHKMVIDPELGEISVDKLDEVKVEVPGRKAAGKQFTSVSKRTVHILKAMFSNDPADKIKLQNLVEGTGARGGYLVPEDFVNIVVEDKRDATIMRPLATVLPVSTDTIHIPNKASQPKAFWRSEGAVKQTTTVDFGETVLTPYSLASIVGISNELVADAQLGGNIVTLVAKYMSRSLAEEEDKAFWTGNGTGKPTGIDNYTFSTVTAAAGASDSAKADKIIQALFVLPQSYRSSAVWVANKNTWAKVATLKDSQNNYLLSDLAGAASPTLRGVRTLEQNDLPDGKMFVGDFSYYYIADRQGIQVDTSTEATVASQSAFERNLTFVRVEERVDGELTLTQPIVEVQGIGGF